MGEQSRTWRATLFLNRQLARLAQQESLGIPEHALPVNSDEIVVIE